MPVQKRRLAGEEGGDVWQLCFDPEKGSLHVEHSWAGAMTTLAPGQPDQRIRGYALWEFLSHDGPGREELRTLLIELFPKAKWRWPNSAAA